MPPMTPRSTVNPFANQLSAVGESMLHSSPVMTDSSSMRPDSDIEDALHRSTTKVLRNESFEQTGFHAPGVLFSSLIHPEMSKPAKAILGTPHWKFEHGLVFRAKRDCPLDRVSFLVASFGIVQLGGLLLT